MKSIWILLLLLGAIGVCPQAPDENEDYEQYADYDNDEDIEKKLNEQIAQLQKLTDVDNDLKVEEEIQQYREADKNNDAIENLKKLIDDFQIEDYPEIDDDTGDLSEVDEESEKKAKHDENRLEPDDNNAPNHNKDYALLWGDDNIAPLPVPETTVSDNQAIFEETAKLLQEENANESEEEIKDIISEKDLQDLNQTTSSYIREMIEEAKKILEETDDSLSNIETNMESSPVPTTIDDTATNTNSNTDMTTIAGEKAEATENKEKSSEEDTVDNVSAKLNADLDKLLETLDKLTEDIDSDNKADSDLVKDEEDDNLFKDENDNPNEDSEEIDEDDANVEIDWDKLMKDILTEDDLKVKEAKPANLEPMLNDALNEPNPDDTSNNDAESIVDVLKPYINDALVDEPKDKETIEKADENIEINASVEEEPSVKTTLVDDLTSAEMKDLVDQFSILHKEDIDVRSEKFNKDVAPVHITLNLDEPTIITSPDYPNPYPTNNIVDWILEGQGVGIELNVTEFAVNGALGDYLLIKPGGVDDSGHEGILFTYRLTSPRLYRFVDVDHLFMRFQSNVGMMFFRGFHISAKMIAPIPETAPPVPEPEAVLSPPHSTTTITVTMPSLAHVQEDLRLILADMAEEYIMENGIEPGLNTTAEVTQITSVGTCPLSWPESTSCSAVTFGVSLVRAEDDQDPRLNEDDLQAMWSTYSKRDPYYLRLSIAGIREFYPPDSSALTAWLVIAGGVVISMAMLAFVLWRYSCFEDYSRMRPYSDTSSLNNEKRNLDLYPTPHQTLPPLYAESEYKWGDDARVDMGGFPNRSYARDDMYDFESDEDVMPPRDRNGAVTARDGYSSNV